MYKTIEKNGRTLRVYEDGRIYKEKFTLVYSDGRSRNYKGYFMKQSINRQGYYHICLRNRSSVKDVLAHRIIAEAFLNNYSEELSVDHIDGNKKNNHISNLRMATKAENLQAFQKKRKNCTSKYKGVYLRRNKWTAQITHDYKNYHLGSHNTEEEAALTYNKKAIELGFGEERLNIINETI